MARSSGRKGKGARKGGAAWEEAMERGYSMNKQGRGEEAAACFEKALALGGEGHANPHAFMGQSLQNAGRIEEAMAHFDRAIEADPRHTMALFKKAEALLALNRVGEARVWCERAIESDPDDAPSHHTMGIIHVHFMDIEGAIAEFSESVRIDPANFRGYANMASPLTVAGRPKEALRCLDAALRINPGYAFAHCQKAETLSRLGRMDEAQKSWEKAVECDPRYMLGDARRHLRPDRLAELNRAGWRGGRPPKGLGKVRAPRGRAKARGRKGGEDDLMLARLRAACELEGISLGDALRAIASGGPGAAGAVPIAERVRRMKAGGGRAGGKGKRGPGRTGGSAGTRGREPARRRKQAGAGG